MINSKKIFLTGVTGLLGSQLLKLLLMSSKNEIYLLVRTVSRITADKKIDSILDFLELDLSIKKKIRIFNGDIEEEYLGLNKYEYNFLRENTQEIFHSAALTKFQEPWGKVYSVNVQGTKNLLFFAQKCINKVQFNYISSTFVAGNFYGNLSEDDLVLNQVFNNTYERSKYEAELFLKKNIASNNAKVKIIIFRPSIIVGDSRNGTSINKGLLYQLFRMLSLEIFRKIPINNQAKLNLIPCDIAAKAIITLSQFGKSNNTYHIISPNSIPLNKLILWTVKYLRIKKPVLVDVNKFNVNEFSPIQRKMLAPFIPYFNLKVNFKFFKTRKMLKNEGFSIPLIKRELLNKLLKDVCKNGYIRRVR